MEVAATREQQARGLMFRDSMAADRGMIFPFDPPEPASFWMENTLIPLDLIFIAPGGRIESIAANAIPYSRDSIRSKGKVEAVLEINGGQAANLGIVPGDKVEWSR